MLEPIYSTLFAAPMTQNPAQKQAVAKVGRGCTTTSHGVGPKTSMPAAPWRLPSSLQIGTTYIFSYFTRTLTSPTYSHHNHPVCHTGAVVEYREVSLLRTTANNMYTDAAAKCLRIESGDSQSSSLGNF